MSSTDIVSHLKLVVELMAEPQNYKHGKQLADLHNFILEMMEINQLITKSKDTDVNTNEDSRFFLFGSQLKIFCEPVESITNDSDNLAPNKELDHLIETVARAHFYFISDRNSIATSSDLKIVCKTNPDFRVNLEDLMTVKELNAKKIDEVCNYLLCSKNVDHLMNLFKRIGFRWTPQTPQIESDYNLIHEIVAIFKCVPYIMTSNENDNPLIIVRYYEYPLVSIGEFEFILLHVHESSNDSEKNLGFCFPSEFYGKKQDSTKKVSWKRKMKLNLDDQKITYNLLDGSKQTIQKSTKYGNAGHFYTSLNFEL